MRIAIVEPNPSFGGGSEQVTLELSEELARRGHEIFLFYSTRSGSMISQYDRFIKRRCEVALKPFGWKTLIGSVCRARNLAREIRAVDADVMFSADLHYVRFLALTKLFSGVPVVLHLGYDNAVSTSSLRWSLKLIAAGISPAQHTANTWLRDGWAPQKIHIVGNWINAGKFSIRDGEEATVNEVLADLPVNGIVACYVGRLAHEKGLSVLLQAWKKCVDIFPTVTLIIVGANASGGLEPYDSMAKELGILGNVRFAGRAKSVAEYYRAADLSIVPSTWNEPFGLTVLEAMASGIPPVVTDVGIMRELVGETIPSLVVPANNVDALAERMIDLMKMPSSLAELGCKLRQRAIDVFSPKRSIDQYESIMEKAARRCTRGHGIELAKYK